MTCVMRHRRETGTPRPPPRVRRQHGRVSLVFELLPVASLSRFLVGVLTPVSTLLTGGEQCWAVSKRRRPGDEKSER